MSFCLLRNAKDAGEDASVMSISASGMGRPIDVNDLRLKHSYTAYSATLVSGPYNDIMKFTKRNPEISFTHIHPGFVKTQPAHWALRLLSPLISLFVWLKAISPEESAEYMLFALFDGEKGIFRLGAKGDDLGMKGYLFTEEQKKAVWDHSVKVTRCA